MKSFGWPGPRPPNAYAMDAYVKVIHAGGSEEAACKAALAAEQRSYQENAEYWVQRIASIMAAQPPAPFVIDRNYSTEIIEPGGDGSGGQTVTGFGFPLPSGSTITGTGKPRRRRRRRRPEK